MATGGAWGWRRLRGRWTSLHWCRRCQWSWHLTRCCQRIKSISNTSNIILHTIAMMIEKTPEILIIFHMFSTEQRERKVGYTSATLSAYMEKSFVTWDNSQWTTNSHTKSSVYCALPHFQYLSLVVFRLIEKIKSKKKNDANFYWQ